MNKQQKIDELLRLLKQRKPLLRDRFLNELRQRLETDNERFVEAWLQAERKEHVIER